MISASFVPVAIVFLTLLSISCHNFLWYSSQLYCAHNYYHNFLWHSSKLSCVHSLSDFPLTYFLTYHPASHFSVTLFVIMIGRHLRNQIRMSFLFGGGNLLSTSRSRYIPHFLKEMLCTTFLETSCIMHAAFHFSATLFIIMMWRHNMHFMNLEQPLRAKCLWVKCSHRHNKFKKQIAVQMTNLFLEQTLIVMIFLEILSWGILLSVIDLVH